MRQNFRIARVLGAMALVCTLATTLAACGRNAVKEEFAKSPDQRSLEIPPALDVAAQSAPAAGTSSQLSSKAANAAAAGGFAVTGDSAAVFAQTGQLLAGIAGLEIVGQAQALGTYDVGYQGEVFLVRVAASGADAWISVMDVRGMQATGPAAQFVLAKLKAELKG